MLILIVFVVIISWFLFKIAAGSMSIGQLNIISAIFYYNIMFNALPGGILIYYTNVTNSVLDKVTAEYRIMGLYLILYMMIAFPLGLLFIKSFFLKLVILAS